MKPPITLETVEKELEERKKEQKVLADKDIISHELLSRLESLETMKYNLLKIQLKDSN